MKPLFEIGEEVMLWSTTLPEAKGVRAVVIDRGFKETMSMETGKINPEHWTYEVDPNPGDPAVRLWHERVLRKIPKGCGKSFTELMESLKGSHVVTE